MTTGFWWILLALAVYGLIHSLFASRRVKLAFERWLGAVVSRYYRLGFSIMAVVTFLPVLALVSFLPDKHIYSIPPPFLVLAILLQLAGAVGVLYGVNQTGFSRFVGLDTALDPPAGRRDLITAGLYRYVRHPLYDCALVVLWLSPVMTWNVLALNLGMTGFFIIGSRFEEDKLIAEFGPAYIEYRRRTPAFLPRLTRTK